MINGAARSACFAPACIPCLAVNGSLLGCDSQAACLQGGNDDAEEWQQWPDEDAEISSSDDDKELSDSGDSLYEQAGVGPRTRAQRRSRRRNKRQRSGPDQGQQQARKRRRLRRGAQHAMDLSDDEHIMDDLEQVYLYLHQM